jgi:hypothetical protein
VHELRNVIAKLPKRAGLHDQVKASYYAALVDATDAADAGRRWRESVAELERPYLSAAACPTDDLPAQCIHLYYFFTLAQALPVLELVGTIAGGCEAADESDRALPRRDQLRQHVLGSARVRHCALCVFKTNARLR